MHFSEDHLSSEHHNVKLDERSGCHNVLSDHNMQQWKGQVKESLCQTEGHHCRVSQVLAKNSSASVSFAPHKKSM